MPPQKPAPAAPSNHLLFDPWNSASSGHQRSESNPGTAWRRTREAKLAQQFRSGDCTINSLVYDGIGRTYEKGEWEWDWGGDAKGGRGGDGRSGSGRAKRAVDQDSKQRDIRSMMGLGKGVFSAELGLGLGNKKGTGAFTSTPPSSTPTQAPTQIPTPPYEAEPYTEDLAPGAFSGTNTTPISAPQTQTQSKPVSSTTRSSSTPAESNILRGAIIYINGQTAPLVSDHKLKSLLVAHGATLSLSLSRRVTHVIIGKPNSGPGRGAGGGLAAGKIQKEMARGGWKGMKIVGVEWVLESVKAGKWLPETRFAVNLGSQRSVLGFM
ncbi:uncharacterized protein DSM5745_02181 [Aspergillus mulundensis]|uniref:BRCT domain-containing protein n=1 Tax=Aspergillus mulundensis TaxID=1810919 RepID=A0A3D8SVS8_9EURO|nr:hypothetical protein DSM5745_02181 [Aspergillus mulundensis]RDW90406.1 hypothetical protein DSM5745_02181 [Aspergillus mulundensis]